MSERKKSDETVVPEKISQRRDAAVLALVSQPTKEKAAEAAGIGLTTLFQWLADPEFVARVDEARRRVFEDGIRSLQGLVGKAAETLMRNMECGVPSVEVRAAQAVLDMGLRGHEVLELAATVERLQGIVDELAPGAVTR